jgi:hypothetical protein
MPYQENLSSFSKKNKSKTFQLALAEAARERTRLERFGEQFGYNVIEDADLSDSDDEDGDESVNDESFEEASASSPKSKRRAPPAETSPVAPTVVTKCV